MKDKYIINPVSNRKVTDLSGQTYGRLLVLELDVETSKNKSKIYWKCYCECGEKISVSGCHLKSGHTKSCGCFKLEKISETHFKDLTGMTFGRLTVKGFSHTTDTGTLWLCDCSCGNTGILVFGSNLTKESGTRSCGCIHREMMSSRFEEDFTGVKFNNLTVIGRDYDKEESTTRKVKYWKCTCTCGNETSVTTSDINSKRQMSCGCVKSKGEYFTNMYLNNNGIAFETQKTFECLKGVGGGLLSYDFYLPDYNLLIECQGEQHVTPMRFKGEDMIEKFNIQNKHDDLKKEYALKNNLKLFEIWYWDYDNIPKILNSKLQ